MCLKIYIHIYFLQWSGLNTSGLQQLAGVHDPPESCDIPIKAEFNGDYHGGSVKTGNG